LTGEVVSCGLEFEGFCWQGAQGAGRLSAWKTRLGATVREIEFDEIPTLVGQELAVTGWRTITQQQVQMFADATGDHQWIHVDVARATRESPFGGPVAHGFLTLSLLPAMLAESVQVNGAVMGVNYGLNRVRFTAPVRVGAELRGRVTIQSANRLAPTDTLTGGPGWQLVWAVTFELRGQERPACVAEMVSRQFAAPTSVQG
jgi:acyl dehydratase